MPEGRMLKKNVSNSKKLGALKSDSARLLYTWLIPFLDVEGRYFADPDLIKGHIFPKVKSMTIDKIKEILQELHDIGLIILYQSDGEEYLQLNKFEDYQSIKKDREALSKIPAPTNENILDSGFSQDNSGVNHENSDTNKVKVSKDKLSKDNMYDFDFEQFWNNYPRKIEKKKAFKVWRRLNKSQKELATIGSENYSLECNHNKTETKYIKHPSTFLNPDNELWEDYQKGIIHKKEINQERDIGKSNPITDEEEQFWIDRKKKEQELSKTLKGKELKIAIADWCHEYWGKENK